jgi:RiboL-PSP-HEPN
MYAHWEGHVSLVSRAYMDFLALRRLRYSSLKECFRLNAFFATIRRMMQARLSYTDQIGFLVSVISSGESQLRNVDEDVLATRSNLNSVVLRDLCCLLALDIKEFEGDVDFLDKILLNRRNNIAHGQFIEINFEMLHDMSDRVIEMMRKFNNLVDNEVNLQGYRA